MGFDTVMTRREDISIHDDSAKTIRQKKISDLHNRLKLINETPDCLFISIHQNSYPYPNNTGTQVFYSAQSPGEPGACGGYSAVRHPLDPAAEYPQGKKIRHRDLFALSGENACPLWWSAASCPTRRKRKSCAQKPIRMNWRYQFFTAFYPTSMESALPTRRRPPNNKWSGKDRSIYGTEVKKRIRMQPMRL